MSFPLYYQILYVKSNYQDSIESHFQICVRIAIREIDFIFYFYIKLKLRAAFALSHICSNVILKSQYQD